MSSEDMTVNLYRLPLCFLVIMHSHLVPPDIGQFDDCKYLVTLLHDAVTSNKEKYQCF